MKSKAKRDFSYLFTWITTVTSSSLLLFLLINPLRTLSGFFCDNVKNRYLLVYIMITFITSAVLAVSIFRLRSKTYDISILTAIIDQVLGGVIHIALFAVLRAGAYIDPGVIILTQYLKLYTTDDIIVENTFSQLVMLCIFQSTVYITISLLSYSASEILSRKIAKSR